MGRLKSLDLVYPCTCTRADIARAASAPHAEDEGPAYPGTCSGRTVEDASGLGNRPFAWRFRVRADRIFWEDSLKGPIGLDPSTLGGDFLVGRSNGTPAYQLAVVCDDAAMGVNQVIRGDDLIASTPRQILLYRSLGREPPAFGHLPLVDGPDGRRLAKRDGSMKLASFRELGRDPRRLVGILAQSLGLGDGIVDSAPADWIQNFDLSAIPKEPWSAPSVW